MSSRWRDIETYDRPAEKLREELSLVRIERLLGGPDPDAPGPVRIDGGRAAVRLNFMPCGANGSHRLKKALHDCVLGAIAPHPAVE